jgi:hypothetical protein
MAEKPGKHKRTSEENWHRLNRGEKNNANGEMKSAVDEACSKISNGGKL